MTQLLQRAWRLWRSNPRLFYRRLIRFLRSPVRNTAALLIAPWRYGRVQKSYTHWIVQQQVIPRYEWPEGPHAPLISVLLPVYNTEQEPLEAAIQSVLNQTYGLWELCIADDASSAPHVRSTLERYRREEPRVRVTYRPQQGHIAEATNSALSRARGDFVVLLDHDDLLAPDALAHLARVIEADPSVDFMYSDEDKLDPDGTHVEPFFKPAWSPTLLSSCNYITHLAAVRRSLILEVGGFRHTAVGSQDYDVFLRVAERARAVAHIPLVLYSWRKSFASTAASSVAKPYAIDAARYALEDSIVRRDLDARLEPLHLNGLFYVRRRLASPTSLSLIILGQGNEWRQVLDLAPMEIPNIVRLGGDTPLSKRSAHEPPAVTSIDELTGEYLLWIDAESRPASVDSILVMLEHLQQSGVGIVGGCTVRGRNGAVLQAALTIGDRGQPAYAYAGLLPVPQPNFYLNLKDLPREVSAVHAGCCAMARSTWRELGGWCGTLPPPLAMVDLCLRSLERGHDIVYAPLALYHSRRDLPRMPLVDRYDWAWQSYVDAFWNPNLTPTSGDGLPFRGRGHRQAWV
jgi:O-antigen biosynthesis protein